jgi:hypothetical protein
MSSAAPPRRVDPNAVVNPYDRRMTGLGLAKRAALGAEAVSQLASRTGSLAGRSTMLHSA